MKRMFRRTIAIANVKRKIVNDTQLLRVQHNKQQAFVRQHYSQNIRICHAHTAPAII